MGAIASSSRPTANEKPRPSERHSLFPLIRTVPVTDPVGIGFALSLAREGRWSNLPPARGYLALQLRLRIVFRVLPPTKLTEASANLKDALLTPLGAGQEPEKSERRLPAAE